MGKRISGQMDLYDVEKRTIQDWKVTSVWSVKDESYKSDWEKQLNIYRWLAKKTGWRPKPWKWLQSLEIGPVWRE